jgi:hypothetical protein
MSRHLSFIGRSKGVYIDAFHGGADEGRCLQLTSNRDFSQLNEEEVRELVAVLTAWLAENIKNPENPEWSPIT